MAKRGFQSEPFYEIQIVKPARVGHQRRRRERLAHLSCRIGTELE